ncbi:uncharacterized protein LOC125941267 [Dermacentor silvarum]|uniref:uncharacterized protein LOC125941267 n=1 Tax=Dermacentor silvarum TaxID=543639 RepID=UPI002100C403|nr:uncharacterized protein LOC125941267 [Dermacentor silvarum]
MCISRTKESLSRTDYKCKLCTGHPTQSCQDESASLRSGSEYPEMVVTKPGGAAVTYLFKYFNTNEWCGIFTYGSNSEMECEMRVRDDQVDHSERTDCEQNYDKICEGKRKYKVYEGYCKS